MSESLNTMICPRKYLLNTSSVKSKCDYIGSNQMVLNDRLPPSADPSDWSFITSIFLRFIRFSVQNDSKDTGQMYSLLYRIRWFFNKQRIFTSNWHSVLLKYHRIRYNNENLREVSLESFWTGNWMKRRKMGVIKLQSEGSAEGGWSIVSMEVYF